jgi:pimeloyl-ACP methyl ester carboxylesterase
MGGSDKLTVEQKQGLEGTEGYGVIADAQLRAMKKLGITEIDVTGQSMGAWAAASLAERAAAQGIKVRHAIIVDSAGVQDMDPEGFINEISKREMAEGKYLDLYQSTPYDPELRHAAGQHHMMIKKKVDLGLWAASTKLNDPGGVYNKSMSKSSLEGTLDQALKNDPDLTVRMVNGTLSQVSPTEANNNIVTTLSSRHPGRVAHSVYPGEPHLVMEDAKRYATQVQLALRT